MTLQKILSRLFECWARLGCGLAGIQYEPVQDDQQNLS